MKKDGPNVELDVYSFMTTAPKCADETRSIHERTPVLLSEEAEFETWLSETPAEAFALARSLDPGSMRIVQSGVCENGTPSVVEKCRKKSLHTSLPFPELFQPCVSANGVMKTWPPFRICLAEPPPCPRSSHRRISTGAVCRNHPDVGSYCRHSIASPLPSRALQYLASPSVGVFP